MEPTLVIAAIGLLGLAGAVALGFVIGKNAAGGKRRAAGLSVALALSVLGAGIALNYVSVLYVLPVAGVVALVVAAAAAIAFFLLLGREVRWRPLMVLALLGFVAAVAVALVAVAMVALPGDWVQPLYATRASQIAEENGFVALMPKDMDLPTDMLPVDALPEPDAGLVFGYEGFTMVQRKSAGAMTESDLEELLAPGSRPLEGFDVPADARVTSHVVRGLPAMAVEYSYSPAKPPEFGRGPLNVAILVFEMDGVEVRMASESGVREDRGEWVPFGNLEVEDLLEIAETLEPVEWR